VKETIAAVIDRAHLTRKQRAAGGGSMVVCMRCGRMIHPDERLPLYFRDGADNRLRVARWQCCWCYELESAEREQQRLRELIVRIRAPVTKTTIVLDGSGSHR